MDKIAVIKHEGDKHVLYANSGKVLGRHSTYEQALRQKRAIIMRKHAGLDKDFAPGLPSKSRFDNIGIKPGLTRIVIQKHNATTPHYDLRLHEGDIAHSFVVHHLPGETDKMLAIRQPTHRASYSDFEGTIEKGYGAGTVKKVYDETVDVIRAGDDKIKLVLPEGEFTMIKLTDPNWLMVKNKNTIKNPVTTKPSYKDMDRKEINFEDQTKVMQPKVDGGHTIFKLQSGDINRVYSYRTSKKDNRPIEHTHQVPILRDAFVPKDLDGTELRGELYARGRDGRPMSSKDVGGILNSGIRNAREKQSLEGQLLPYIFDIVKFKGKDVSNLDYSKKLAMMNQIQKRIPQFRVAETAQMPEEKREMLNLITDKKHPDTYEGVVQWDLSSPGGDPKKVKLRDTHDVVIRKIFPAISPKPIPFAGGFEYSWEKESPVVGRVGTGFSQATREDMLAHPEKYVGMIARIKTQEVYPSGAARAPSFYNLHVERNLEKTSAKNIMKYLSDKCLNIPRDKMPQISKVDLKDFISDLRSDRVKVVKDKINAEKLHPTQKEINSDKVDDFPVEHIGKKPIIVSSDNHIMDGHHQWAKALLFGNKKLDCIKVSLPIKKLLDKANDFDGVEHKTFMNKKAALSNAAQSLLTGATIGGLGGALIAPKGERLQSAAMGTIGGIAAAGPAEAGVLKLKAMLSGERAKNIFMNTMRRQTPKAAAIGATIGTGATLAVNKAVGAYDPQKKQGKGSELLRAAAPWADDAAMAAVIAARALK